MNKENLLYLFLSVSLSSGRNILSKKTAADSDQRAAFFLSQTVLFAAAASLLFVFGAKDLVSVSAMTLIYGTTYGVLLVLSQWMFTLSLKSGNTSVCSVVYSLGFILPTISGTLFWKETLRLLDFIGILVAVLIVLLAAKKSESSLRKRNRSFFGYILTAMLSSGGLGIMQKLQQSSKEAEEKEAFLLIAFLFAFCCSLLALLLCREQPTIRMKRNVYPVFTGLCFGGANLCNTVLAGRMKSAVFFPIQNILTILLSALLGVVIFRERLTLKTAAILLLGIAVIVLFSV